MSAGDSVPYFPYYGTCSAIHPAQSSCWSVPPIRFFQVARWMLPIYSALHLIPAVLFKRETFMRNPLKVLLKAAIGTGRSSAFLGIFVIIYQCKFPFNSRSCGFTWFFFSSDELLQKSVTRVSFYIVTFLSSLPSRSEDTQAPHWFIGFEVFVLYPWAVLWAGIVCGGGEAILSTSYSAVV